MQAGIQSQAETQEAQSAPAFRELPQNERFLQHALGTQGDVRLPAMLLTLALIAAVLAVALKKARDRKKLRNTNAQG